MPSCKIVAQLKELVQLLTRQEWKRRAGGYFAILTGFERQDCHLAVGSLPDLWNTHSSKNWQTWHQGSRDLDVNRQVRRRHAWLLRIATKPDDFGMLNVEAAVGLACAPGPGPTYGHGPSVNPIHAPGIGEVDYHERKSPVDLLMQLRGSHELQCALIEGNTRYVPAGIVRKDVFEQLPGHIR